MPVTVTAVDGGLGNSGDETLDDWVLFTGKGSWYSVLLVACDRVYTVPSAE